MGLALSKPLACRTGVICICVCVCLRHTEASASLITRSVSHAQGSWSPCAWLTPHAHFALASACLKNAKMYDCFAGKQTFIHFTPVLLGIWITTTCFSNIQTEVSLFIKLSAASWVGSRSSCSGFKLLGAWQGVFRDGSVPWHTCVLHLARKFNATSKSVDICLFLTCFNYRKKSSWMSRKTKNKKYVH